MRNFRELRVWQDGIDLATLTYGITNSFPSNEEYGITRQIRRSAISIPSNVAEGCSRSSDKEFCHFLEIANGSAFELETQLIISNRVNLLSDRNLKEGTVPLIQIQKAISTLIKQIRRTQP